MPLKKIIIFSLFVYSSLIISKTAQAQTTTCNSGQSSYQCILCNCYHESRGESYNGKLAVAKVILSRASSGSFPGSACRVVYQASQFSWTFDDVSNDISAKKPEDKNAFAECKQISNVALSEGGNGLLYFYNPKKAQPAWAKRMRVCGTIGNHTFLVSKDKECPASLTSSSLLQGAIGGDANFKGPRNLGRPAKKGVVR